MSGPADRQGSGAPTQEIAGEPSPKADLATGSRAPRAPMVLVTVALGAATATVVFAYATGYQVLAVMAVRGEVPAAATATVAGLAAAALLLFGPAVEAWHAARRTGQLVVGHVAEMGHVADARVAAARARSLAWSTLGYAAAAGLLLLLALFVVANNLAVGETFFDVKVMGESAGLVAEAFLVNVEIFCMAEILILGWALVIVLARMAPGAAGRPLRLLATAYVDIFRALPAIIAIYLIGFGLPLTGLQIFDAVPQPVFAVIALTLTYGAYVSEVYRAGIESVHPSQTAAARSLGLSYAQTMRHVVLPQALRRVVPPLLNDFISLQKDTALVNVIGAIDAFNQAKMAASKHFNLSSVTTVALLFVVITIPQTRLADRLLAANSRRQG